VASRRVLGALAVAVVALSLAEAAHAADPAIRELSSGDVYASPLALGPETARARARLDREARRLADRGDGVKLAVVAGPAGARTMRAYVRTLRATLAYDGTLVVSAPDRPVVAVGPLPPAEITAALRREQVNQLVDPVERVLAAAPLAAPPPPAGSSLRGVIGLAVLALIGGAWAAAWGIRRERRHARVALIDARALARLRLDAVSGHALDLGGRPDLPPEARAVLADARTGAGEVRALVNTARSAEHVASAEGALRRVEDLVRKAAALGGDPLDPEDPFAGLCAVDPVHGAGTERGPVAEAQGLRALCPACAAAGDAGEPRARRVVPVRGRPVPFDEAGLDIAAGERGASG
jgi:hypothetical protein